MKNKFFKDLKNGEEIYLLGKETLNILPLEVTSFHSHNYEKYGENVIADTVKYIKFTSYEDAVSVKTILEKLSKDNNSLYKVSVSCEEIIEIFSAYKKGQTIQCQKLYDNYVKWGGGYCRLTNLDDSPIDIDKNHVFDFYEFTYRVKPELLCSYRPYKNALEFINASKEHGPYLTKDGQEFVNPVFVGKNKIGVFYSTECYIKYSYNKLLEKGMHWQDGTVCGYV